MNIGKLLYSHFQGLKTASPLGYLVLPLFPLYSHHYANRACPKEIMSAAECVFCEDPSCI